LVWLLLQQEHTNIKKKKLMGTVIIIEHTILLGQEASKLFIHSIAFFIIVSYLDDLNSLIQTAFKPPKTLGFNQIKPCPAIGN